MRKNGNKGSISLEACIVVPIFIMLMMLVYGLFVMFMGQQVVTHAVTQGAKSLAYDPYAIERGAANSEAKLTDFFGSILRKDGYVSNTKWYSTDSKKLNSVVTSRVRSYLTQDGGKEKISTVNNKLKTFGVRNGVYGLKFTDSKVENGVLTLKVTYKQEFPMDAFGLVGFDRAVTVKVRLFTWKKLPNSIYEISFNSNGGSTVTKKVTNESNDKLPKPTRNNYAFLGWSTDPHAETPNIPDLSAAKKLGEEKGDQTLYAVWFPTRKVETYVADDDTSGTYENVIKGKRNKRINANADDGTDYHSDKIYEYVDVGMTPRQILDLGLTTVHVEVKFKAMTNGNECAAVRIYSNGKEHKYQKFNVGGGWGDNYYVVSCSFPVSELASDGKIKIRWSAIDGGGWPGDKNDDIWTLGRTIVTIYLD